MTPIFELLNLFRTPFFFRIKRFSKVSTNFGLLLSLLIYAVLILSFSESDIFYRISPRIINNTKIVNKRPLINSDSNFLAVSVTDINGLPYNDPSIFTIKLSSLKYELNPDDKESYFPYYLKEENLKFFHFCHENDTLKPQDFYDLALENYYCADEGNFQVEGSFLEPLALKLFSVELSFCKNSTENNNTCKSLNEIHYFLQNKVFTLIYFDNAIQVNDYKNPVQKKYNVVNQRISSKLSKYINVYLQEASIFTNDGVIFTNRDSQKVFQTERQDFDFKYIEENETYDLLNNFAFVFYSSSKVVEIERTYQTLAESIAILGGLYSFLFFIGRIIVYLDNILFLTRTILNHLYVFPSNENNEKPNSTKVLDKLAPSIRSDLGNKEKLTQTEKWRLFKRVTDKQTQFHIGVIQYIKLKIKKFFRFNINDREKLYLKAEKIFDQEIDVIHLLKRNQEIEKIKYLLLNRKQILLFKFLEKPMIHLGNQNVPSNYLYFNEDITEKELKEAYEYYSYLENSNQCSTIEKKILSLADKRLKNLANLS